MTDAAAVLDVASAVVRKITRGVLLALLEAIDCLEDRLDDVARRARRRSADRRGVG
jgi:hypothetical protein